MRLQRQVFFLRAVFFAVLFLLPQYSYAADLSLNPPTGTVSVGSTISVKVTVTPGTDSINASDGAISFDSTLLSVSSISKDGSVFSLWTADPSYSNTDGTIKYSGGTPTAFSNSGTILTIVFKAKAAGSAAITFSKGSILAADGKGTDVYKNGKGSTLTVTAAADVPAPADTSAVDTSSSNTSSTDGAPPVAPVISSPTFPKLDKWYATSTAVFTWLISSDVTALRTLLSTNATDTPKVTLKGGATTTQTVTGITDGVSYFYVQAKNDFGWGDVAVFKMQVDTTPPLAFEVGLQAPGSDGGPSKLTFKTDDLLSGMDHYEIILGTSTPISVSATDITDGTYPVPPQGGGLEQVTVRAFDKAGNFTESVKQLTLPLVAKPKPADTPTDTSTTPASSGFGVEGFMLVLLALLAGGIIAWNIYTRKTAGREKELLFAAVLEVRDKNDRIFSAMREEFDLLINNFDEKPQLTPQERALSENIKEILEVSEELIDTGIEDLKKMVRNQS